MKSQNGIIKEITECELYKLYIDYKMEDNMSFNDYKEWFIALGVKVI